MTSLPIITEDNEVTYSAYTGVGPLAFTFPYFQKEDLNVDVDGVTLSRSAWDDTPNPIDGGNDGGSILLNVAVANKNVRIWRDTVRLRATQYGVGGATPAQVNTDLNRLVTMVQDRARNEEEGAYSQGEVNALLADKLTAPKFDSYAAARLGSGLTTGTLVRVNGRTASGDGGEGWFRVSATGVDRDGLQLLMADTKCLIREDFKEQIDLDWFGIAPGVVTVADFNTMVSSVNFQTTRDVRARAGVYQFGSAPATLTTILRLMGRGEGLTTLERNYSEGGGDTVPFIRFQDANAQNSGLFDMLVRPASGTTGGTMVSFHATTTSILSRNYLSGVWISPESGAYAWALRADGTANTTSGSQGIRNLFIENCRLFGGAGTGSNAIYLANVVNCNFLGLWTNGNIHLTGGGSSVTNSTRVSFAALTCLGTFTIENCDHVSVQGTMDDVVINGTATNVTIMGDVEDLTIASGATGVAIVRARGTITNNAPATFTVISQNGSSVGQGLIELCRATIDMNTTADQPITVRLPPGFTRFGVQTGFAANNSSANLASAVGGVYTDASKGGTQIVANTQAYSTLTGANLRQTIAAASTTAVYTDTTLFVSLTTPAGVAGTVDYVLYGYVFT